MADMGELHSADCIYNLRRALHGTDRFGGVKSCTVNDERGAEAAEGIDVSICLHGQDDSPSVLGLHVGVGGGGPGDEAPEAEVVDDILDPLDVVLDGIGALAENVVFEVEQLEAGEDVLDKGADDHGQVKVAVGDGVCGEARQVLRQVGEGEEILLDGEVEGVAVLEVGRGWKSFVLGRSATKGRGRARASGIGHREARTGEDGADVVERQKAANVGHGRGGGREAAEPGAVDGGAHGALHGARPLGVIPGGGGTTGRRQSSVGRQTRGTGDERRGQTDL